MFEIKTDFLADVVRQQAQIRPDAIAHIFNGRETTFGDLNEAANRAAQGFIAEGCKPDARVANMGKNSDLYFEMLAGALRSKTVLVGVNWRLAPPEVAYVLKDSRTEILFVTEDFYGLIDEIKDDCPDLRQIIAMDGGHGTWPSYEDWSARFEAVDPKLPHAPQDDVLQLYTSGTTGYPKGVQLTNDNLKDVVRQAREGGWADWHAGERNMVCMPLFHVAGVNIGLLGQICGCCNIILKDVDPRVILDLVEEHEINLFFMVPAIILFLIQQPDIRTRKLSSIRSILYGASPISDEVLTKAQEIFQCGFIQVYGLTETTGAASSLTPADHVKGGKLLRSCGRPNPGVQARIVDDHDNPLPTGEVGEICLKGAFVMKSYWNRPEATEEAIVDGWFHTGDAGFFDEDGYLYIHDRVKDMIVSGGENIYPAEVENGLFSHPAIADVAVIGIPDDKWGEAVKAIVVLQPGTEASPEDIIAYAKTQIAGFKVPKSVDYTDVLPRNPSGKVLRRELREPYWKGRERNVN